MGITFSFGQVQLRDLTVLEPGKFFWLPQGTGHPLTLSVLLQPYPGNTSFRMIDLEGEYAFQVRGGRMPPTGQQYVWEAPWPDVRIEMPAMVTQVAGTEKQGSLLVSDAGAFIVAKIKSSSGFTDPAFISVLDWSVDARTPRTYFPVADWRFVRIDNNGDKIPILEAAPN